MNGKALQFALAALLVLALAGVVFLDFGASSPGELARVHADVPELSGAGGCVACHGDQETSMRAACGACHADVTEQIAAERGLHGRLSEELAADCGHCHVEHRGTSFDLIADRSFVASGVQGGLVGYRHEGLPFALEGRHVELTCEKCHRHAAEQPLTKGHKRFLGLSQACESCHEDPHAGRLPKCAECHGQERPFEEVALFEHDPRFVLTGSHAGVACKTCHDPSSARSIEALGQLRTTGQRAEVRTCAACHAHGHSESMLAAIASQRGLVGDRTCAACHEVPDSEFARPGKERTRTLHGVLGLELTAPHDRADCTACHEGSPKERYPGRDPKRCATCHGSAHSQGFLAAVATRVAVDVGVTCDTCHGGGRRAFTALDEAANRRLHSATGFALDAPHDRAACAKCHKGIGEAASPGEVKRAHQARFPGRAAADCVACHEDPHFGQFAEGAFAGQNCTACHGTAAFHPVAFGHAEHGKTAFPLTGAHRAVGCGVCHVRAKGRKTLTFRDAPTRCNECHADVHDEYFGKRDCAQCHGTESFAVRDFDHTKWTRFPLVGRHEKAACSKCHPATLPTHGGTRTMDHAKQGCADCHADVHAGQFAKQGRTDCAKCHTPEGGFDTLLFDHGKHSRFKLDEQHVKLACAKCHKSYDLPRGGKVVRYRPLGTTCVDCHGWEKKPR